MKDMKWQGAAIGLVSALALGFLLYLLYGRGPVAGDSGRLSFLPALNAACNAVTTLLIARGILLIRRGHRDRHKQSMLGAFAASTLFLIGYILYHAVHGDTRFTGQGWIRPVYFSVLVSHVLLSAVALPLVLTAFYLSLTDRLERHKKLARITYPIWLYVSVTGVAIFFILKTFNHV
jgi:putative membrane protein